MKKQRKYRLGAASNNYRGGRGGGGLDRFYGMPTITLIFRRGITLDNKNILYIKKLNFYFYLFSIFIIKYNRKQSGQL